VATKWVRNIPVGMCDVTIRLARPDTPREETVTFSHDPSAGFDVDLANSYFLSFTVPMKATLPNVYTILGAHVLGQADAQNQVAIDSTAAPENGTRTIAVGNLTSPQVAALIRKKTNFAGKAMRGRMFLPGIVESDLDHLGKLTSTVRGNLQTAVDQMYADLTTFGKVMLAHSCSYDDATQQPCIPRSWTEVTKFEVDEMSATQRRRMAR
jgi:hypothetical protein